MYDSLKHESALCCHAYLSVINNLLLAQHITLLESKILARKLQIVSRKCKRKLAFEHSIAD